MTRPLRIEFPGAIYHVTSRGNVEQRGQVLNLELIMSLGMDSKEI